MLRMIVALLSVVAVFGANDPWAKVRDLKSGTELRVFKIGSKQPVLATFDELTDEKLVVATKKEQIAISRDEIERIDYRPPQPGGRVKAESTSKTTDNVVTAGKPPGTGRTGQSVESSGGLTFGGKADFETIYRKLATLPKK